MNSVVVPRSPFGENPLFQSLAETGKRQDLLRPTSSAAQKALTAAQYKVSPHRNIKVGAAFIYTVDNMFHFL